MYIIILHFSIKQRYVQLDFDYIPMHLALSYITFPNFSKSCIIEGISFLCGSGVQILKWLSIQKAKVYDARLWILSYTYYCKLNCFPTYLKSCVIECIFYCLIWWSVFQMVIHTKVKRAEGCTWVVWVFIYRLLCYLRWWLCPVPSWYCSKLLLR
jgi:uncharacterized membrane protein HdeD (DUF308 family)